METPHTTPTPPPIPENLNPHALMKTVAFAAAGGIVLTLLADILLWGQSPGMAVGIYFLSVAGFTIGTRWGKWKGGVHWIALGLLLPACIATAVEISFTNICVLVGLLAVVCGESWYGGLPAGAQRWTESFVGWVKSPGQWPWLFDTAARVAPGIFGRDSRVPARAGRVAKMFAPALFLLVIFSTMFGFGNPVYGNMLDRAGNHFGNFVGSFDFSIGHMLFVMAFATLGLAFAHPHAAPVIPRKWARVVPSMHRLDVTVAIWQSRLVLVALNILFFVVNTLDVIYLWCHANLPAGTTFSDFVHRGVWSLVTAVLLSALVITAIFQQQAEVRGGRFLKVAALVWIVQNLVLIAGVFLRLRLYVSAYELSEERIYVGCFLLLVIAGFALLAWHVARAWNFKALIFGNVLATFALFFILQFANVAGWVAHYNVKRWQHEPQRALDVPYLSSLGPGAWPALAEVASSRNNVSNAVTQARLALAQQAGREAMRMQDSDWRSWQARRDSQVKWLIAESAKYPQPPASEPNENASDERSLSR